MALFKKPVIEPAPTPPRVFNERRRTIRTINDEAEFRIHGITTALDIISARRFLAMGMTHHQAAETVLSWTSRKQQEEL